MLLDTDILIDLWRKHPPAITWFDGLPNLPPVAGFSGMEFLQGGKDLPDLRSAARLLRQFPLVWPSEVAMNNAVWELAPYRLSHGLGMTDALIAITAIESDEPLATFNVKHFNAVPGLVTVQPYTR